MMDDIIGGVDVIMGKNVISQLGRVTLYENGAMKFRGAHCVVITQPTAMTRKNSGTSPCKVKDKNFSQSFDGERWTVCCILTPAELSK